MEPLTILVVTKTAAAIYLALFLIVAAIIGYVTSYLYYKPIYMRKIHALEAEVEERKNDIKMLNEKVTGLEVKLNMKEEECKELQVKIKEAKIS